MTWTITDPPARPVTHRTDEATGVYWNTYHDSSTTRHQIGFTPAFYCQIDDDVPELVQAMRDIAAYAASRHAEAVAANSRRKQEAGK